MAWDSKQQTYIDRHIARGLCRNCSNAAKPKPNGDLFRYCEPCLEKRRRHGAALRAVLPAMGRCVYCHHKNGDPAFKLCGACRRFKQARRRAYREAQRCIRCGGPSPRFFSCRACRADESARLETKRLAGRASPFTTAVSPASSSMTSGKIGKAVRGCHGSD